MKRILVIHSDFSSAHLYKNEQFSQSENKKVFGRCFTEYGHGHNYKIEVGFQIPVQFKDHKLVKAQQNLTKELQKLTRTLDHEHLNFVIPEFKTVVPTTENILLYFEKKLKALKLASPLAFIRLFEMENLWSEKHYVTEK